MFSRKSIVDFSALVFLGLVLALVWVVYLPGVSGGFLFDDYSNLEDLGTYGGVVNFETFKSFVFHGISGPLGRPLSLASFLLDDNTWPSSPANFKPTNIKIHLIAGLFLCWASLNLLRVLGYQESKAVWIALISGAIWMLHPYMVSTTLYIIQRMAQLAALFVFMGLAGYFHGRLLLNTQVRRALFWMTSSLVICTGLAVLSKENGILLPLLILVIEACLPKENNRALQWWRWIFLWVPTAVILIYLIKCINFSGHPWTERIFSQSDRVLTQPRILWEYLLHLYVPRIEGRGLFQDGYVVSRGLFSPISTFIAIVGMVALVGAAIFFRRRYPLWGIAILFYFASQLLESTWLNLELYFEHRNYVAAAFLFLPLSAGLVGLTEKIDKKLVVVCVLLCLSILTFLTWKRTELWSNGDRLELYWAVATPESARARNRVSTYLLSQNRSNDAIAYMTKAVEELPNSSLLTINLLIVKVHLNVATQADFIESAERMKVQPFDAQAIKGLRSLAEKLSMSDSDTHYAEHALVLIDAVKLNKNYASIPIFNRLHAYLQGMLQVRLGNYEAGLESYQKAIQLYAETDAALSMVAEMANAGRPKEALILLRDAEKVYAAQNEKTLVRSKAVYDSEFKKMHEILELAEHSFE